MRLYSQFCRLGLLPTGKVLILLFSLFFFSGFSLRNVLDNSSAIFFMVLLGMGYFLISFFSIKVGLIILCLSMLFSPEFSVGELGTRDIVLRIEDLLIPLLMVAWVAGVAIGRRKHLFKKSPLNKPIGCLLLVTVYSTLSGYATGWVVPSAIFYIGKTVEYFIIFYLVLNYIETERQIKLFLFFMLLTFVMLGLYTLLQVPTVEMFTVNRITAPFEGDASPATAGGYMAFFIIILFSLFLFEKTMWKKFTLAVILGTVFIPFLFTLSRTSYAAFLAGMLMLTILAKRKGLYLLFFGLLLLSPVLLPDPVIERIMFTWEDAKHPGRTLGVDYSLQERILSFNRTFTALKRSPFFGLGVTSFNYMDNQYARTLHEIGTVGLLIWFWIYWRLYRISRWLYAFYTGGLFKGLVLGYSAGIVCILIHAMGSMTFYIVRIMEPFWFISGLVVALYLIKLREYSAPPQPVAASEMNPALDNPVSV